MKVLSSIGYRGTIRSLESEEMKISSVTISIFCHETEDCDKIKKAVEGVFPSVNEADMNLHKVKGHFGNYIYLLEYKFVKSLAGVAFEEILSRISSTDLLVILTTLTSRMEKSKLYLRFDKQYLVGKEEMVLREGNDVVRVMISFNEPSNVVVKELRRLASNRAMHKETRSNKLP